MKAESSEEATAENFESGKEWFMRFKKKKKQKPNP
jgi:hypothetical protein